MKTLITALLVLSAVLYACQSDNACKGNACKAERDFYEGVLL